jgi:hypothetical protein
MLVLLAYKDLHFLIVSLTLLVTENQCPLWVRSGNNSVYALCPLFPSEQKFVWRTYRSVQCRERTFASVATGSGSPG